MYSAISEKISETITLQRQTSSRYIEFFVFRNVDINELWTTDISEDKTHDVWPAVNEKSFKKFLENELTSYQRPIPLLGIPQNGTVSKTCKKEKQRETDCVNYERKRGNPVTFYPRHRAKRNANTDTCISEEPSILVSHHRNSKMDVFMDTNKITLVNRELIWVPHDQVRIVKLDISLYIPDGFFGVITGHSNDVFCECVTEIITDETDISVFLMNLSEHSLMLLPGDVEFSINFLPCYIPEPWEMINLSPPEFAIFHLKASREFIAKPNSYTIQYFDAMYVCADELKALMIPSKEIAKLGLLIETYIWNKDTIPSIKIFNSTRKTIYIPTGICIARIIFTCGHFCLSLMPERAINRLQVLDANSSFLFHYAASNNA
ncbi:U45 [Human betaherpesvirus 6A]|uniref:Deoxyuridine 5'-triphosphate nucleotidohydrolase n=1 Tax=Human herpesvirus 6A (strain Uganda-1102) TaxID=10370 RepID=DUT_HHV6U|nr:U45 [Human betaherpesvirus 6A]Q06095.1 RecName: Full=Deoxyuridine 5'-triphosphate nucleotidohydrolase; Short=dUTPase; AltName: Full=dUTP pyrophosphatase [Human herpesvirus 6 (strain Uganda-1102)]CAA45600.1 BHLF3 [Human betaherpesvirus 6A]CAA58379.1 U45 [Human betaherpesvirus 6A]